MPIKNLRVGNVAETKKNCTQLVRGGIVILGPTLSFELSKGKRSTKDGKKIGGEVYGTTSTKPMTESVVGRFPTHPTLKVRGAIQ